MEVKELRLAAGMTQKEFAAYFGIPIHQIQHWEQGYRSPKLYVTAMMERIFYNEGVIMSNYSGKIEDICYEWVISNKTTTLIFWNKDERHIIKAKESFTDHYMMLYHKQFAEMYIEEWIGQKKFAETARSLDY